MPIEYIDGKWLDVEARRSLPRYSRWSPDELAIDFARKVFECMRHNHEKEEKERLWDMDWQIKCYKKRWDDYESGVKKARQWFYASYLSWFEIKTKRAYDTQMIHAARMCFEACWVDLYKATEGLWCTKYVSDELKTKHFLPNGLPEMPFPKQARWMNKPFKLDHCLATELIDYEISHLFDHAMRAAMCYSEENIQRDAESIGNHIINGIMKELNELPEDLSLLEYPAIVDDFCDQVVSFKVAAPVVNNELEQWCRDSIANNKKSADEFRSGKEGAINALKGPVMKLAKGKIEPKLVDETLRKLLKS